MIYFPIVTDKERRHSNIFWLERYAVRET